MILDYQTAKKLEALIHPDVEKAIIALLDAALRQKEDIQDNPNATDAELRQFQGQRALIKELKGYRERIKEAVKREKDGPEYPTDL